MNENTKSDVADCILSFAQAMQNAGGCIQSPHALKELSMWEFLTEVAPQNHIRFTWEPPQSEERQ